MYSEKLAEQADLIPGLMNKEVGNVKGKKDLLRGTFIHTWVFSVLDICTLSLIVESLLNPADCWAGRARR